jgi:hypothetical protein
MTKILLQLNLIPTGVIIVTPTKKWMFLLNLTFSQSKTNEMPNCVNVKTNGLD